MSSPTDKDNVDSGQGAGAFPATEWNLILAASREDSSDGGTALETLCRQYWYPVYAHVRHVGYWVEEAKDLTQEFFARLLAHHSLAAADPARGQFRSFIRASLRNFLANEWDRSHTTKRGGGRPCLSMDDLDAEERYAIERSQEASPEVAYDRAWACMIIELVLRRMRKDYVRSGKEEQFAILERHVSGGGEDLSCVALARQLGLTRSAAKSAAYRFRQRFAMTLRGEIARTVPRREDIDEEIRQLAAAVAGG